LLNALSLGPALVTIFIQNITSEAEPVIVTADPSTIIKWTDPGD